jgi:uncharacterized membrane protein
MNQTNFVRLLTFIALGFTLFFAATVVPPLIQEPDVIGAFSAGFVNPYSTGYSVDVILCWWILVALVLYDTTRSRIPYRWVCVVLGIVPGVAVGLSLYLILRARHFDQPSRSPKITGEHHGSD